MKGEQGGGEGSGPGEPVMGFAAKFTRSDWTLGSHQVNKVLKLQHQSFSE